MIRLIASDLDGTLLQNDAQELTPRAFKLIRRLTEKGIIFVPASGRQYDNVVSLFEPIKDNIFYIVENGSLCIHEGKVFSHTFINRDLINRILEEVKQDGRFEIMISGEDSYFIEDNDPDFVNHVVNVLKSTTQIVEDVRNVEGPILKVAVCNMKDGSQVIREYLKNLQDKFGAEIKIVTSGNIWIDFIAPGTNKGTALSKLLDELQISPEECMAFGDQYNDVEMLQTAGISYAMSSSAPGISRYATHVTDSVEDVLEELLNTLENEEIGSK